MVDDLLFSRLAAAYVRGKLQHVPDEALDPALFTARLDELDAPQQAALLALGRAQGLRMHRFKRTMGLARVAKVIGILQGVMPSDLLDIGSGRGAFLWPLLDALPQLPVTALDSLNYRVADILAVADGGVTNLRAVQGSATDLPFDDRSFDLVTMLEVLEHIPDTTTALREGFRVARRFLVLSVPSKPDDNPEHIHLFDAATLERLLRTCGAIRVSFAYVPGHIITVAKRGS
jgi:ubiquinone/menaquinone biosynthesis C-methylase UbiE